MSASRLANFKASIEAAFVARTPPDDGSGVRYSWIESFTSERGHGQHRELIWGRPSRTAQLSRASVLNEYEITASLHLHRRDRTIADFNQAILDEPLTLQLAYLAQAAAGFGEGVAAAKMLDEPVPDDQASAKPRSGGVPSDVVAVIPIKFRVTVREGGTS